MGNSQKMRWFSVMMLLVLGACTRAELPAQGAQDPMQFAAAELKRADKLLVLIPGAFASVGLFGPKTRWQRAGYGVIEYRFPGLDGLALDHRLEVDNAAVQIASLMRAHPEKPLYLLGYSTGAAIAFSAAEKLENRNIKIAALSSAVPYPSTLTTGLNGAIDIISAAVRARSVNRQKVWLSYYETLLFGRKGLRNPALQAEIARFKAAVMDRLSAPSAELSSSHSAGIRNWRPTFAAGNAKIRFFHGMEDPVITDGQLARFAARIPGAEINGYQDHGHLLFLTAPHVFDDVLSFFEE